MTQGGGSGSAKGSEAMTNNLRCGDVGHPKHACQLDLIVGALGERAGSGRGAAGGLARAAQTSDIERAALKPRAAAPYPAAPSSTPRERLFSSIFAFIALRSSLRLC